MILDKEEALAFLRKHQPMPPDDKLTEELITEYDEIRKFCIEHPDPECIPLFLNSFGEGSGFGVYQLVEDVFMQFPPEEVVPHLVKALRSRVHSVRDWAAEIAAQFPEPKLIEPLRNILVEHNEDPAIRSWAASSIKFIDHPAIDEILNRVQKHERNVEVRDEILDAMKHRDDALRVTRRRSAGGSEGR